MPSPTPQRALPAVAALLAAALWAGAHLMVHTPRGWPMDVPGEWDLLLTALAIASGNAPDAAIGTLHGNELGSYLVAALVALPVTLGMDVVAAGKWVALAFGAGSAGVVGWLAAWLGLRAGAASKDALTGAVMAGALMAAAWPGLHFELAGVNGRTPESLLPQLLAVALLVTLSPDAGRPALLRRALGVGVVLSVGWLLSPVTLWTLGACGVGAMVLLRSWPDRALATAGAAAGVLLPLALFAWLVPGGTDGLELFRVEQFGGGLAVSDDASGTPTGLALLGYVHQALEGGAHNPDLWRRGLLLGLLGWAVLLGLTSAIAWAIRRGDGRGPEALAAGIALSWLVPLFLLPSDKWFYPLAYRYWVLLLAVGIALIPVLALRLRRLGPTGETAGRAVFFGGAVIAGLCGATLPRSFVAPAPSRAEALVSAGAHRMNARPGHGRHAAFLALAPHVQERDLPALAEGYGLALGGDMAVDFADERPGEMPWDAPLALHGRAQTAFLFGVGCGVTSAEQIAPTALSAMVDSGEARGPMLAGLARCAGDRPDGQVAPADPDGSARVTSTVPDPAALMPPRW